MAKKTVKSAASKSKAAPKAKAAPKEKKVAVKEKAKKEAKPVKAAKTVKPEKPVKPTKEPKVLPKTLKASVEEKPAEILNPTMAKVLSEAPKQPKVEKKPEKPEKALKVGKKASALKALAEGAADAKKWAELKDKYAKEKAPKYLMSGVFQALTPLMHEKLGWGFILSNNNDRLEVLFESGTKVLISNYNPNK